MDPLVAAIDQGTSSTRFLVSDVVESVETLWVISLLPSQQLTRDEDFD